MRLQPLFLSGLLSLILAVGFNTSQAQNSINEEYCRPLCINDQQLLAPITLVSANLNNDCLHLVVEYSGGCLRHKFCLGWNGALAESLPPQAFLYVQHKDPGDPCDAIVTQHLYFDVSKIQEKPYKHIILNVIGSNKTISLNYTY